MQPVSLLVIAKRPVAGRVKTRLTPPCTPDQAARLARAALLDTLQVVERSPAADRVLVLDGDPADWRRTGWRVLPQRGGGLAQRLQCAFDDVTGPALLVGMDTPQLTPDLVAGAVRSLARPGVDAVLGPTLDGGYWSVGFNRPVADAFRGVPMSCGVTCERQRRRLRELGLRVHPQPVLRDVDTIADARAVAAQAPGTRFARTLAAL